MSKAIALTYAMTLLGVPYSYGGNTPLGLDCSGFSIEVLKSVGILPSHFRSSADGLYRTLIQMGHQSVQACESGAHAFFGVKDHISHVAICIDDRFIIEAGGGTSTTITLDDAKKDNAFVRIRPIAMHTDLVDIVMPNY